MSTTSKLGADMTEAEINEIAAQIYGTQATEQEIRFARALLARQPAAIDKQEAVTDERRQAARDAVAAALGDAYDCMRVWEAWSVGTMGQDDFRLVTDDESRIAEIADAAIDALYAAPLANEASEPAAPSGEQADPTDYEALEREHLGDAEKRTGIYAPSVEQDERAAFEEWARDEGMDLERGIIGAGAYNNASTQACWRGWKHRARAASTSANVAQAKSGYQYAQPGSPLFDGAEAYQQYLEAEAERPQLPAWFDAFLTNVCEIPDRNSPEDEPEAVVATLEELESCALRAIEDSSDSTGVCFFCGEAMSGNHEKDCPQADKSANVAQGAEMHICGECDRQFRAAPPAKTATTDTQRLDWLDAINAPFKMGWRVSIAPAGNASVASVIQLGGARTSIREAIDAALTAAQSASASEGKC